MHPHHLNDLLANDRVNIPFVQEEGCDGDPGASGEACPGFSDESVGAGTASSETL